MAVSGGALHRQPCPFLKALPLTWGTWPAFLSPGTLSQQSLESHSFPGSPGDMCATDIISKCHLLQSLWMAQAGVSPTPQTLRLTLTTAFWREQHTWTAEELDNVRDVMSPASTLPCHRHSDYIAWGACHGMYRCAQV